MLFELITNKANSSITKYIKTILKGRISVTFHSLVSLKKRRTFEAVAGLYSVIGSRA